MGLGVPVDDDHDEDSLMAELAALQGKPVGGQQKEKPKRGLLII